ncbi:hypothetical protein HNR44_001724 [Geomicrobium halophilum]|uniref:Uncharacterized protein n=1 Tax=Geomicrobium halophilum TaxID=549000 RepID=A0A841PRE8_9BACL|nr:hypothetical protein [Geomicrobium halophilum]MBB6449746.1 hypothetical protein [Geomicrobium halophilum]
MNISERLKEKLLAEESGSVTWRYSDVWDLMIENLDKYQSGEKMDAFRQSPCESLLSSSILDHWVHVKEQMENAEHESLKIDFMYEFWKHISYKFKNAGINENEIISWMNREKKRNRVLNHATHAFLWEEIETRCRSLIKLL